MAPRASWENRRPARGQDTPLPDTGEPKIVQRVRGQFASWAAVSVGCLGINVATGLDTPWFLFPTFGMGIGLLKNYAKLWQSGYSWRDVLSRPPAPDAMETRMRVGAGGKLPRQLPLPRREEFGSHYQDIEQVYKDRHAILRRYDKLAPNIRKDLADIHETVDGLYNRAVDLARTLHLMETDLKGEGDIARIEEKLAALEAEPDREQRTRQIDLLERQKRTVGDLSARRGQVAAHLESCVLAMQNLRLDLLKLSSSNVSEVMGDITQATQQARALSRNVDHAIEAAAEIREALR